jgi:hypothetical protein
MWTCIDARKAAFHKFRIASQPGDILVVIVSLPCGAVQMGYEHQSSQYGMVSYAGSDGAARVQQALLGKLSHITMSATLYLSY